MATNLVCTAGGKLEPVFVCFPRKIEHDSHYPHYLFCINSISSFTEPFYTTYFFMVLLSALLLFICPQAHISSPFPTCCITVAPSTLLPLSHVCHSLSSVAIQQLCPDFSEALASKIQYLPGQTQNQYPPNANTAHRQFSGSANDTGSYPATEFNDFRAETTKKINHPSVVSNALERLSNAVLDNTQYISFATVLHDKLNTLHLFDALEYYSNCSCANNCSSGKEIRFA